MIDWDRVAILREEVGEEGFSLIVEVFLEEIGEGIARLGRVAAPDLQQARRARARIRARGEDVAVILDVTVAVAGDFRSARRVLGPTDHTVHYAGTVDGLAGLISDIARAEVADGVREGRLVVLPEVGHLAPAEDPEATVAALETQALGAEN